MKTRFFVTIVALLLTLSVSAQPPRIREEARRMTNSVDRRVGLSRDQYDRIYRVNIRFASREIGPGERDRAYRRIMGPRQWDRYVGRGPAPRHHYRPGPPPRRDYRPGPPPRRDYGRRGPGPRDRRRDYDRRRY